MNNTNTRLFNETDPWDRWFGRVLDLIETYDIDMWSYINCNWNVQPMWHNIGFGDTRLSSNDEVMKKWQKYIIESRGKQKFLLGNSLECQFEIDNDDETQISSRSHRDYTIKSFSHFSALVVVVYTAAFLARKLIQFIPSRKATNHERQPFRGDSISYTI